MKCRHCRAPLDLPFIDLGSAPPSNAYLDKAAAVGSPRRGSRCASSSARSCWLVQTEDYAHHAELFASDYAYFSSFSTSWLRACGALCRRRWSSASVSARPPAWSRSRPTTATCCSTSRHAASPASASNRPPARRREAARARASRSRGVLRRRLWPNGCVAEGRAADLTAANNVLAHVPDINDFVAGFARLLKPQGVATFEFPHLLQLVDQCQFDTIYHEHFSYLSLTAVRRIFERNGLAVFDVEELPTHGGSLRVFAQRADTGRRERSAAVDAAAGARDIGRAEHAGLLRGLPGTRRPREGRLAALPARGQAARQDASWPTAPPPRATRCSTTPASAPTCSPSSWTGTRPSRARYMPGSRIPIVAPQQLRSRAARLRRDPALEPEGRGHAAASVRTPVGRPHS